jgi:hypothetical protein
LKYGSGCNDTEYTKDVLQHINTLTLAHLWIMPCTHDMLYSSLDPQPLITYVLEFIKEHISNCVSNVCIVNAILVKWNLAWVTLGDPLLKY